MTKLSSSSEPEKQQQQQSLITSTIIQRTTPDEYLSKPFISFPNPPNNISKTVTSSLEPIAVAIVTTSIILSTSPRQPSLPSDFIRKSLLGEHLPAESSSQRKYSTPSSIYTISGLTQNEQDYLNREVLSPDKFKQHMIATAALSQHQPPTSLPDGGPARMMIGVTSTGPAEALVNKYRSDLERRDKDRNEKEREIDFLRSSLRGSKKLQSLEHGDELQTTITGPGGGGIDTIVSPNANHNNFYYNEAFTPEEDRRQPFAPANQMVRLTSEGYDHQAPNLNLDIDSVLYRMNELLKSFKAKTLTSSSNKLTTTTPINKEEIDNLTLINAFLSDPQFRNAYEAYKKVVLEGSRKPPTTPPPSPSIGHIDKSALTATSSSPLSDNHRQVQNLLNNPDLFRNHSQAQILSHLSHLLLKPPSIDARRELYLPPKDKSAGPESPSTLHKGYSKSLDESITSSNQALFSPIMTMAPAMTGLVRQGQEEQLQPTYELPGNYGPGESSAALNNYPETANIKVIKIDKGPDPLGATIRNDGDAVVIARIMNNGAAQRTGALREGDEILEINGVRMIGKSVHEVCDILSDMNGTLSFVINRPPTMAGIPGFYGGSHLTQPLYPPDHRQQPNGIINTGGAGTGDLGSLHSPYEEQPMSVRANFNYDPEEDLYIPCRELGLSFQKGDILHVINQDDLNWWQAYRDGEDVQGLAGLVPSKNFQIQRETLKRTLFGSDQPSSAQRRKKIDGRKANGGVGGREYTTKPSLDTSGLPINIKKKKEKNATTTSTTLTSWTDDLCGSENLASRLCTSAVDYCSPSNWARKHGTATGHRKRDEIDEYECDEILTYEEVELYYPQPIKKRPIVLIGPPDIGRHELRQRLMEEFPERFAAAVPHTSRLQRFGEIDGQDYHFLSRQAFEAEIMAGKFVEHGEFEKALYGTSLASIRKVIDSGKNCILNLHPQSLKILYHSDLMPYVVFIAPPNIEKLRIIEEKRGVFKKDDELIEIIEKAREIEENFGHYFDVFIINADLAKTYAQLLDEINRIECEPQWVPKFWLHYPNTQLTGDGRIQGYYTDSIGRGGNGISGLGDNDQRGAFQHGYSDSGIVNHAFNPSFDLQPYGYEENENPSIDQNVEPSGGYYTFDSRDYHAFNDPSRYANPTEQIIQYSSSKQKYIS